MSTFPSVTIAVFEKQAAASLALSRLQKAGITAMLDEEVDDSAPLQAGRVADLIQLKVHERNVEEATAVLADDAFEKANEVLPGDLPEEPLNSREELAQRAWNGALISLAALPIQLFVFWLVLKVYFSKEPLRASLRKRAWIAAAISLPVVLIAIPIFSLLLTELLRGVLSYFWRY